MLVITTKLNRKRLATGVVTLCMLLAVIGITLPNSATPVSGEISKIKLQTQKEHIAFLESYGWKVEEEPVEFEEILIPSEFDEVYIEYNNLQKEQGMDLEKYSGKRVMHYVYSITNYPGNDSGVIANLLVYKNKLIGADVCSTNLNGFMHGLKRPE